MSGIEDLTALVDRIVAASEPLTPSEIREIEQNGYRQAWGFPEVPYSDGLQAKLAQADQPPIPLPSLVS